MSASSQNPGFDERQRAELDRLRAGQQPPAPSPVPAVLLVMLGAALSYIAYRMDHHGCVGVAPDMHSAYQRFCVGHGYLELRAGQLAPTGAALLAGAGALSLPRALRALLLTVGLIATVALFVAVIAAVDSLPVA